MTSPLGGYRPGRGPLHRLRPGTKLLALFVFATAVVLAKGVPAAAAALGIGFALTIIAGLRGRDLWRVSRGFAFIAVPLFAFQWWQRGWEHGFEVVADLLALILAASAFTASTTMDDMIDTVTRALRPLRPLGVRPDRVALAFSLVMTSIPTLLALARETRDAAKARGLERSLRALLVPFVLRTVAHAQLLGEALAARGIGDDEA